MTHQRLAPYSPRLILGVESSCDETSLAVLEDGVKIRASLVSSQAELHKKYGGVVPELACRKHLEVLNPLYDECLSQAGVSPRQLEAVAVTCGPGLIGAVLLGVAFAKTLALVLDRPLIGVNHLEGHLASVFLQEPELEPPLVCLLVSGGHTLLVHLPSWEGLEVLGQTRDDAAGEAFDKVAKLLGLGYPGGPLVDRLSRSGRRDALDFPRPMRDRGYEFSFSGLKTAVLVERKAHPEVSVEDVCASFQAAVVEVLATKLLRAARDKGVPTIAMAGGVACNSELRSELTRRADELGLRLVVPSPALCTDNAAMIARAGWEAARLGWRSTLELEAEASLPLSFRGLP